MSAVPARATTPDPELIRIGDAVRRYGWFAVHVPREPHHPPYTYSIGLYQTHHHPELLISGLPPHTCHGLMGEVADRLYRGRPAPVTGRCHGPVVAHPITYRTILPEHAVRLLPMAYRYYRHFPAPCSVLQVVWSDPAGRFPWDIDFELSLQGRQPRLWEPSPRLV